LSKYALLMWYVKYIHFILITIQFFPHSWLITGFVTRLTRRVSHMGQELPTLPEHLSSSLVFRRVRVARSLVYCVMFCWSLFVIFLLAIELYVLWLPLDIFKTFLTHFTIMVLEVDIHRACAFLLEFRCQIGVHVSLRCPV
jgi:hypothetical protein